MILDFSKLRNFMQKIIKKSILVMHLRYQRTKWRSETDNLMFKCGTQKVDSFRNDINIRLMTME